MHFDFISIFGYHKVNFGNEKAVELAKLATDTNNFDIVENLPYPISLLKKKLQDSVFKELQEYWKNSEKGRDTYNVIKKVDINFACSIFHYES